MKKWIGLILVLLLVGCSKKEEMPSLQPRNLNYEYGQKVFFRMDDLLDLTAFTQDEIDTLEKDGNIDTSTLVYDDAGNIEVGQYNIKITYQDEVVYSILNIEDAKELFEFTDVEEIEIQAGDINHDFSTDVIAVCVNGDQAILDFDTSKINFNQAGSYPLYLTVTDSSGNSQTHIYTVVVNQATTNQKQSSENTGKTPAANQSAGTSTSTNHTNTNQSTVHSNTTNNNTGTTTINTAPADPTENTTTVENQTVPDSGESETPAVPENDTTLDSTVENTPVTDTDETTASDESVESAETNN